MSNEPKPAPYEWVYANINGESRCIGLVQGNRDIMIATGDGHSAWLDFAPTAKTMILRAIERTRQPIPADIFASDREALADFSQPSPSDPHALNCALRLFFAGNSHDGAGRRGEFDYC